MGKRTFTAEYKTQVVLEVLREERQLGEIAAEHGISPNQLRNWKREFLENASRVFNESKREKEIRTKEKELEAERAELLSTIGLKPHMHIFPEKYSNIQKNIIDCADDFMEIFLTEICICDIFGHIDGVAVCGLFDGIQVTSQSSKKGLFCGYVEWGRSLPCFIETTISVFASENETENSLVMEIEAPILLWKSI